MVSRRRQPCAAPSIIATVGRPTEPIAKCVSAGTAAKQARRHQLNNTASIINILLYCHVGAEAVGSAYASASPDVPLSLHNIRGSALLRWLQSHFGSSTTVRVHRILAEPNADIRNSPLRHRPDEARLATCALQGRHKTDSDDLTLGSPKKFLRMFLCRPGTLAPLRSVDVPPFHFHPRLSSGHRPQRHPVCHAEPTTCAVPLTQPPAILPPGWCCEMLAMPGQACSGGQERTSACASKYTRRSPQ